MSSGGWEVVGKNKKDKNNSKSAKLTKAEKKKFLENAPKVEDFLPLSQVKTLYDNLDGNKENKKPLKEKESKTKENEEKKKQPKQQQQQQQQEKKKQEPKEKVPKSLKEALNSIKPEELENVLSSGQAHFPDAPLIWLKDLAAYLNMKIPQEYEDPVFSGKPKDYPLCLLPKPIFTVLEKAIDLAGVQTSTFFYEVTLTAMASDMAKGTAVTGHKIFLQLLATWNPEITAANTPKLVTLRNSYQNRKAIGLSLLWALAQSGRKNSAIGLKLWHEVMASMIESKNYCTYVAQILHDIVFDNNESEQLDTEVYLNIVDDICNGKVSVSSPIGKQMCVAMEKLRTAVFQNPTTNYRKLFEVTLDKITSKTNNTYNDELIKALFACLCADTRCFLTWRNLYSKHLFQSQLLLAHIDNCWDDVRPHVNSKALKESLEDFMMSREKWKKGKDESLANSCARSSKAILLKMTVSKSKKGRGFPWKKGSFFLLLLIGAVVALDCQKHGSFQASSTGHFLKKSGLCAYGQKAWVLTKFYSDKGLEYVEASFPDHYKAVVDFSTPYVKLANNMGLIVRNASIKVYNNTAAYVAQKKPVVVATIESYAPGLLNEIHVRTLQGVELAKTYSAFIGEKAVEHSTKATRWLQTNVFVGKLSPESLQNYAAKAIDTTQSFASQTYDWVYEKVQTLSKVQ